MIGGIKKILYFPIASYFKFFAQIRLNRWNPRIIVITGSSGKTTLLHLIESQLGTAAKYSHQANSSFGIPFDILDLHRKNLIFSEWPILFLLAPFTAFKAPPKEKLYIVEADVDRPNEGKFLADLLNPEVTLWTGVGKTHAANFNQLLKNKNFSIVEDAIGYEFGFYLESTSKLAIVNGDSDLINKQTKRSKAEIKNASQKNTDYYKLFKDRTEFRIKGKTYLINALLPKEASLSIQMTLSLLECLDVKPDYSFSKFTLPPGRSGIFKGIKNTTIIDSSYNATPDGVISILEMFEFYPSNKKWLVLGDMIELGEEEKEEHEKLAEIIGRMKLEKIILVGPRVSKYTYPKIKNAEKFLMPKDAMGYLTNNLKGREVVLFKGARFLEGIIEHLLADKADVSNLCRREKIWQQRRKKWGL